MTQVAKCHLNYALNYIFCDLVVTRQSDKWRSYDWNITFTYQFRCIITYFAKWLSIRHLKEHFDQTWMYNFRPKFVFVSNEAINGQNKE